MCRPTWWMSSTSARATRMTFLLSIWLATEERSDKNTCIFILARTLIGLMHSSSLYHHWDMCDPKWHPDLKGIHKVEQKNMTDLGVWHHQPQPNFSLKLKSLNCPFEEMDKAPLLRLSSLRSGGCSCAMEISRPSDEEEVIINGIPCRSIWKEHSLLTVFCLWSTTACTSDILISN